MRGNLVSVTSPLLALAAPPWLTPASDARLLLLRVGHGGAPGDGGDDREEEGRILSEGTRPSLTLDERAVDSVHGEREEVEGVREVE